MSSSEPLRGAADARERRHNPRMHQGGKLSFRTRLQDGADRPGDRLVFGGDDPPWLRELAPEHVRDVEIEIGPGKGAFVLAATAAKPDTFVLGIEAAPGYAGLAATRLYAAGRTNGLFLVDNGKLYLEDRVDDGELAAVHVYFPDPWPKRRHARRRFFTTDVVPVLARALRDGGFCYVATDNAAYAGQVARVMGSARQFVRDEAEEQRVLLLGPGHAFTPTNFERKYVEEGRTIRRYAFRRLAR
jgi:tRNA (guanine-N7-)-methyltransferase